MPDWDADSEQLRVNLTGVLEEISESAHRRERPTIEWSLRSHRDMMKGLRAPKAEYVGAFRGAPGLEQVQVRVGSHYGTPASEVTWELARFENKLQNLVGELDLLIPAGDEPDEDQQAAVVDLCAWVHSEWVRIHPFANGNGRIARLWANGIAMRYGLPPFIRLRPRPGGGYGEAGAKAMQGDWKPTAKVFQRLLDEVLDNG